MKPTGILTALRRGAYLHHLQLLSEAPARLADFYGSARASPLRGSWPGMVHVNDQTVNDLPQSPMGGLGQSGKDRVLAGLNSRANSPNGHGSQ